MQGEDDINYDEQYQHYYVDHPGAHHHNAWDDYSGGADHVSADDLDGCTDKHVVVVDLEHYLDLKRRAQHIRPDHDAFGSDRPAPAAVRRRDDDHHDGAALDPRDGRR